MKLFLCCKKTKTYLTKAEYYVCDENKEYTKFLVNKSKKDLKLFGGDILNGKILAECDFEIKEIDEDAWLRIRSDERISHIDRYHVLKDSGFSIDKFEKHLSKRHGYVLYLNDLSIYDKYKETSDFKRELKKDEPCEFECAGFPGAIQPSMKYYIDLGKQENSKFNLIEMATDLDEIPRTLKEIYYYDDEAKHWKKGVMLALDSRELRDILNKEQTVILRKSIPNFLKKRVSLLSLANGK